MDISTASLVPRLVPDLRPSADAAASARITEPAAALPPAAAAPPASPQQGGLVARGLLDPRAVTPAGRAMGGERAEAPPRILKPYGVPMLPAEERRPMDEAEPRPAAEKDTRAAGARSEETEPEEVPAAEPSRGDPAPTGRVAGTALPRVSSSA